MLSLTLLVSNIKKDSVITDSHDSGAHDGNNHHRVR